jgi:fimbrial isopeptide formation D2 family protein/LPXTG-motif cell wall-anchored protein
MEEERKGKNMKKISKILMLLLVAMLAMAIGVTALATEEKTTEKKTDTHTISVADTDTHTYDVYQILVGDLYGKTLSNIEWGSSVTPTEGKVTIATDEGNKAMTATEFAKYLEGKSGVDVVSAVDKVIDKTKDPLDTVDKDHSLTAVTGYYVMVDATVIVDRTEERTGEVVSLKDTKALNVIQLVHDVTVTVKWGTTEDKKTIVADTLGEGSEEKTLEDGAKTDNVSIGDTVKYQIETKVPDNAKQFKEGTFFFVITDKLSEGLTFTKGSIEVTANGKTLTERTDYTVRYPEGADSNTFEIGLINARDYESQTIVVTYSAVLNEKAKIGEEGNPNTSHVEFSNNPNKTYDGTVEKTDEKGFPDSTKDVPTGETPESKTITYSTGIQIQKVDEDGNVLTGATFEISGKSVKKVVTKTETFEAAGDGTYYKLKNGTYTTTAPTTENQMDSAAPGATKGYVADSDAIGDDVVMVGTQRYRPYVPATDAGKDLFVLHEGSAALYDGEAPYTKYKKTVNQKTVDSDATDYKMSEAVDANGLVRFDGLGAGEYTITETVTPDGYNTLDPIKFTVEYNANGTAKFSVKDGTYDYDEKEGIIKITIENKKGGTLPETGGIGTTIFYIGGSILVLAALILLVTRRRMSAND